MDESDTIELEQMSHAVNGPAKPPDVNRDGEKVTKKVLHTLPKAEDVNEACTRPDEGEYEQSPKLDETDETDKTQVSSPIPEAHSPWSRLRQS